MSLLLRLLTTGKSLVGLKDEIHRYRLSTQNLLPKFGSGRNPFAECEVRNAECGVSKGSASRPVPKTEVDSAKQSSKGGADECGVRSREGEVGRAEGEISPEPVSGAAKQVAARPVPRESPSGTGVKASEAENRGGLRLLGRWFGRRSTQTSKLMVPVIKSPIQYELSLDRVKVVRNDLSDTDLEIVRSRPIKPKGVVPIASPQKTLGQVQSRVARATTRLLGALKT